MTFKYAPSWKRFVAYVIDGILISLISFMINWNVGIPDVMHEWLSFTMFLIYNILMDYAFQGTIGKKILKLKVIRTNGQRPDMAASFYRNFGKIVSALPLYWGLYDY